MTMSRSVHDIVWVSASFQPHKCLGSQHLYCTFWGLHSSAYEDYFLDGIPWQCQQYVTLKCQQISTKQSASHPSMW